MSKTRNEYLDIVKGIAIIFVVLGHCIQFGSGKEVFTSECFYDDALFKFIYCFHMPVFMAVSGYLFFYSTEKSTKTIIYNKIRSILFPLVSWNTLALCLLIISGDCIWDCSILYSYFHTLWFLRSLFICCILTLFINRLFNDNIWIFITLCILLYFIPNSYIANVIVFTIPFFIMGYLSNKYEMPKRIQNLSKLMKGIIIVFSFLLFIVLLLFYKKNYSVYVSGCYLFNLEYSPSFILFANLYRNIAAITGCIVIFVCIYYWLQLKLFIKIKPLFIECSKASLIIYIINHYLNNTILIKMPLYEINYLNSICESTAIILVSYIIFFIMKRSKLCRLCFLGGR